MALGLPVLMVLSGGSIDLWRASTQRMALQDAADSSALAGARKYGDPPSTAVTPTSAATSFLAANFTSTPISSKSVTADSTAKTVDVVATGQVLGVFTPMIGISTIAVSAHAKAVAIPTGNPVCLLALNATSGSSISLGGSTNLSAAPCTVWSNSTSNQSVTMTGGGSITASKICLQGGSNRPNNLSPAAVSCGARADPFAAMSPTTATTCTQNNFSTSGGSSLSPGVYCGGLSISGNSSYTLEPGTYVIRDGAFRVSGGASLTGTGVTFVLEGTATIDLSGGAVYQFTAPTTGDLAGFVFYQRPTASPGTTAILTGSGRMYYEGVIYFPTQTVRLAGTGGISTTSPLSAFIADKFDLVGNSTISFDYAPTRLTTYVPNGVYSGATVIRLVK